MTIVAKVRFKSKNPLRRYDDSRERARSCSTTDSDSLMARRKKTGLSAILGDISPTALLLHPATLFVAFNVALAVTAIWCWDRYQDKITGPHATLLSEDRIEINSPPAWTKTNIKEAILTSTGQPKSLLDPSLISDAVATCQTIGWIEQVQHLSLIHI